MARKVLLETTYTFTPSSRQVTIPRVIPRERLILITNVTTNQVIYNFSDPNLRATAYASSTNAAGVESTSITLNYNTASMSGSDRLQFVIDEYDEKFSPSEVMMDPVGKLRVSEPQSLIDTDFEYGTQPTKWESVSLLNNKTSAFYDSTTPLNVTALSGTGTRTVTVVAANSPAVGTPVFIQESTNPIANGWYLVESVGAGNTNFTYTARANVTNGSMFDTTKSFSYSGNFYTQAAIPVSSSAGAAFVASGTEITCTTTHAHGLTIGDGIFVRDTSGATPAINGSWIVRRVPTSNTFIFDVAASTTGTITATGGSQNLYQRAFGSVVHRPYDGGVNFSAGTPYHGNQLVRQTRRYFRYQSGKGIQFSTGTNLRPSFQVDNITSSGTTVTVTTKFPHNLGISSVTTSINPTVTVSGATQTAYNGTFTIATVPSDTTFTYTAGSTPSASPATGFPLTVTPVNWWGSRIRVGMFDELNGFFFEYDGQTLYAVRRTSTDQLAGTVSVTLGSPVVTGTNTRFADQVVPGEYVVIRGMPYMVISVTSQTQMIVSPEYRGASVSGNLIIAKRTDSRAPQSSWNIDRCDGTGPSGYSVNLSTMQMLYMDYSWYGAGAIRFGFKNQRGEVIYAHRIANANYRTEAYMRSGNLPARYECNTQPPFTFLTATLANNGTTATVSDTSLFPSQGHLVIQQAGNTNALVEYMSYTGKTATTFTGLTRAVTSITGPLSLVSAGGTATAATFTQSATAPIQVSLHIPTFTPVLSHWGSSVIMDGKFDDDKSFIFTSGMNNPIGIASNTTNSLMSIRLAPSVDNGVPGVLGAREVINRMQLTLRSIGILANGQFLVSVILNGRVSAGTFSAAGGSSLSQVAQHTAATTITGGETIFAFYTNNSGGANFNVTTADLNLVRDLGNSIVGGAANNTCPTTANNLYPDGPDVVTIVARNVGITTAQIAARLSWTEAQA